MNDTQVFLIHIAEDKINTFFGEVLVEGIMLEVLDPKELGDRWQNVSFIGKTNADQRESTLEVFNANLVSDVIIKYTKQYSFEEKYEEGSVTKVLENWQEKHLLDAAQKLTRSSISNKKFLQQKSILKKTKSGWDITILKDLKALYTKYEISQKTQSIRENIFRLTSDSNALFACFIVPQDDFEAVEKKLNQSGIDYEVTTWVKPIIFESGVSQEDFTDLSISSFDSKFLWILGLFSFLFSSIVIHDTLIGLMILLISLLAQKFDLKYKNMSGQMWLGFGSIITGIISGSFGSNLLSILSKSSIESVQIISNNLEIFFGLFKIVDWTGENLSLLVNSTVDGKTEALHSWLFIIFCTLVCIVFFVAQMIRIIKDFALNNNKKAVAGLVFLVNLIISFFCIVGLIPIWTVAISIFGLLVYQPQLKFGPKIMSFLFGQYGLIGFLKKAFWALSFFSLFGIMIGYTSLLNLINKSLEGNLILLGFANILVSIIVWQVTFAIAKRVLRENFLEYFVPRASKANQRIFNPITKYKYWRF